MIANAPKHSGASGASAAPALTARAEAATGSGTTPTLMGRGKKGWVAITDNVLIPMRGRVPLGLAVQPAERTPVKDDRRHVLVHGDVVNP